MITLGDQPQITSQVIDIPQQSTNGRSRHSSSMSPRDIQCNFLVSTPTFSQPDSLSSSLKHRWVSVVTLVNVDKYGSIEELEEFRKTSLSKTYHHQERRSSLSDALLLEGVILPTTSHQQRLDDFKIKK